MSWYVYRFMGSRNGESWTDVTDLAPHPTWTIPEAVKWARAEIEQNSMLKRYAFLQLQRRQGSYRPRGRWKTHFAWCFGQPTAIEVTAAGSD